MPRIGTVAAVMGVVSGSWVIATYFLRCGSNAVCIAFGPSTPGIQGALTAGLGVILVLVAFVSFVGPKTLFYVGALLCALIDLLELSSYAAMAPGALYAALLLVTIALVLDVVAARERTGVSEQSHPMNLPVFG